MARIIRSHPPFFLLRRIYRYWTSDSEKATLSGSSCNHSTDTPEDACPQNDCSEDDWSDDDWPEDGLPTPLTSDSALNRVQQSPSSPSQLQRNKCYEQHTYSIQEPRLVLELPCIVTFVPNRAHPRRCKTLIFTPDKLGRDGRICAWLGKLSEQELDDFFSNQGAASNQDPGVTQKQPLFISGRILQTLFFPPSADSTFSATTARKKPVANRPIRASVAFPHLRFRNSLSKLPIAHQKSRIPQQATPDPISSDSHESGSTGATSSKPASSLPAQSSGESTSASCSSGQRRACLCCGGDHSIPSRETQKVVTMYPIELARSPKVVERVKLRKPEEPIVDSTQVDDEEPLCLVVGPIRKSSARREAEMKLKKVKTLRLKA
ncbi:hypothetical protein CPB84DRAFT_1202458 [Gymnopilus junonius]|uniref:Uncharacterized protein n=1 Tax=Gymnopilus junonius TaxID=109634 RepID=A0A9P5TM30_GYMJU|nr:hypothetical protein CPB84DRAFT_1202458 [Gymnopilus junonius]